MSTESDEKDTTTSMRISSALKRQLKATGSMGEYMQRAAEDRMRRYREARALLDAEGWAANELRAACDALNGFAVTYSIPLGEQIAAELEDAQYVDSVAARHDVDKERWDELVDAVREQEPLARAVRDVATEVWGPSRHVNLESDDEPESDDAGSDGKSGSGGARGNGAAPHSA